MTFTTCMNQLPTVLSVSATNVTANDLLTITGLNFGEFACQNKVLIGNYLCPLVSNSSTELVCQLGLNSGLIPALANSLEVVVNNVGYALKNDSSQIQFQPQISSVVPLVSSTEGGLEVVITGDGFLDRSTVVQIGEDYYSTDDLEVTASTVTIKSTKAAVDGSYALKAFVNSVEAQGGLMFGYSDAATPQLDSVAPAELNIYSSAHSISLAGSGFGVDTAAVTVTIGSEDCSVTSVIDTAIVCDVVGLVAGVNWINVHIRGIRISFLNVLI